MTREQAQAILEKTISHSEAENAEASLDGSNSESTRFANNVITQNIAKTAASLSIRSAFGNKVGSAATNDFTDEGILALVRKSEAIAKASAPNTEYMPPLDPQEYIASDAHDPAIPASTPIERAQAIKAASDLCRRADLQSAGSYLTEAGFHAVANSKNLFAYHQNTFARFSNTVMTPSSSGWYGETSHRMSDVDPLRVTQIAVDRALTAQDPDEIEPGDYTVILEPAAVAELLSFARWSMDAKAAHEGRSAFSGKEGTKVASDSVTMYSSPGDPNCPGSPFLGDGFPARDITWIENGVLTNLLYSRFWAERSGKEPTGFPTNFLMKPGDKTLDEMIASTDNGLLITRFWYIRFVERMNLLLTGMTRDGFYKIEGGKVTKGLKQMRFNESPLVVLANVEAIGQPSRIGTYGPMYMPPIKVANFTLSSKTTF